MGEKKFIIELKIVINNSLYKKKIIDENTFINVQELLLKELNTL